MFKCNSYSLKLNVAWYQDLYTLYVCYSVGTEIEREMVTTQAVVSRTNEIAVR